MRTKHRRGGLSQPPDVDLPVVSRFSMTGILVPLATPIPLFMFFLYAVEVLFHATPLALNKADSCRKTPPGFIAEIAHLGSLKNQVKMPIDRSITGGGRFTFKAWLKKSYKNLYPGHKEMHTQ